MTTSEQIKEKVKSMTPEQLEAVTVGMLSVIEAIDKPEEPQIGDRCIFWDDDIKEYHTGLFEIHSPGGYECLTSRGVSWWKNCKKLTSDAE